MYPWKDALSSWAESSRLQIDALGLITIIGAEEVNTAVGRLVPSRYIEFLPLLGAFLLASDAFVKKQPNFALYNLTDYIMTTELAGWFSRWLKMQDFHQVNHRIYWEMRKPPLPAISYPWTALAVSIPCNGALLALTLLSGDWWGFASVSAMIVSVAVRVVLVSQNRAGIDKAIDGIVDTQREQQPEHKGQLAKVIVIMDDSKVITMKIPRALVGPIFTQTPQVPHPKIYRLSRWIGWTAFAAHIISIGMATLPTQIYTIVLIVVSTVLTAFKFGCDDWRMRQNVTYEMRKRKTSETRENPGVSCAISAQLMAICSEHPDRDDGWFQRDEQSTEPTPAELSTSDTGSHRQKPPSDLEAQLPTSSAAFLVGNEMKRPARRQDLFAWLGLNENELELMKTWNLVPLPQNKGWWKSFDDKRKQARTAKRV